MRRWRLPQRVAGHHDARAVAARVLELHVWREDGMTMVAGMPTGGVVGEHLRMMPADMA